MLGNASEHVGEPGLRINIIHLGRNDQAVHYRGTLAATIGAAEQPGFSPRAIPRTPRSAALLDRQMTKAERKAAWIASAPSLTKRLAEYQPQAIVSLLKGMKTVVEDAATAGGCRAPVYTVAFPGMGNQERFRAEMAACSRCFPKPRKLR
jgi:hypothetical protein